MTFQIHVDDRMLPFVCVSVVYICSLLGATAVPSMSLRVARTPEITVRLCHEGRTRHKHFSTHKMPLPSVDDGIIEAFPLYLIEAYLPVILSCDASINHLDRPGYESSIVAKEKRDKASNFLRLANSVQWYDVACRAFKGFGNHVFDIFNHRSVDEAPT
jgi:hypothetical protein